MSARAAEWTFVKVHDVTKREMYNVARAAMAGEPGEPSEHLDFDFVVPPPPIAARGSRGRA